MSIGSLALLYLRVSSWVEVQSYLVALSIRQPWVFIQFQLFPDLSTNFKNSCPKFWLFWTLFRLCFQSQSGQGLRPWLFVVSLLLSYRVVYSWRFTSKYGRRIEASWSSLIKSVLLHSPLSLEELIFAIFADLTLEFSLAFITWIVNNSHPSSVHVPYGLLSAQFWCGKNNAVPFWLLLASGLIIICWILFFLTSAGIWWTLVPMYSWDFLNW